MAIFQYSILQYFTLYDGKQFSNVIVHTSGINDHDCKQYLNPLISIEEFDWKRKYFTYRKNCKCIPMGQRLSNIIYFSHDDLVFYFLKTLIVWCQGLFLQYVVCVCLCVSAADVMWTDIGHMDHCLIRLSFILLFVRPVCFS